MHLMSVVSEGNISKAKLLIENGISPDVYDYDLRTSIHISASDGMLLTVAFLVEKCNCEINPVDRWDKTPMQVGVTRIGMCQATASVPPLAPQILYLTACARMACA